MSTISIFRREEETKRFAAGEVILNAGDYGSEMYVVVEGEVEILFGDELEETVTSGGMFGELALIDHRPRAATARAKTDCKLAVIDRRRFTFLVQETPFFALHVMQIMSERLRRHGGAV